MSKKNKAKTRIRERGPNFETNYSVSSLISNSKPSKLNIRSFMNELSPSVKINSSIKEKVLENLLALKNASIIPSEISNNEEIKKKKINFKKEKTIKNNFFDNNDEKSTNKKKKQNFNSSDEKFKIVHKREKNLNSSQEIKSENNRKSYVKKIIYKSMKQNNNQGNLFTNKNIEQKNENEKDLVFQQFIEEEQVSTVTSNGGIMNKIKMSNLEKNLEKIKDNINNIEKHETVRQMKSNLKEFLLVNSSFSIYFENLIGCIEKLFLDKKPLSIDKKFENKSSERTLSIQTKREIDEEKLWLKNKILDQRKLIDYYENLKNSFLIMFSQIKDNGIDLEKVFKININQMLKNIDDKTSEQPTPSNSINKSDIQVKNEYFSGNLFAKS